VATASIPVIITTAYTMTFDPLERFGCDCFIPKPFDLTDLETQINSLLQ
jgi:CheY-like chemotaxis protein